LRTPRFLAVLLLALIALVLGACGGSDEEDGGGASSDDVNTLLEQTFTGEKKMDSGNLSVNFTLEAQGEGAEELQGPVKVTLEGPFDATDQESMPKFALEASLEGAGQNLQAGATSTGDKGFVSFQGTQYVVADQVFEQFKTQYEQAREQAESQQQGQQQSFATLGMDPRKWLVDPKTDGEAQVGDTDTVKITAGIDMNALLDDANKALESAAALGATQGQEIPERLTDEQRRQVSEVIKDPRIEIYTGEDDSILRRLVLSLGIDAPDSGGTGSMNLDIAITDLNEPQDIAEPDDAQPFDQLLDQLGALGALGAAGSGSGSGGGQGGSGGAAGGDFEAYSECLEKAGNDVDKARACADLLAP
jgi:hypothetical protein